MYINKARLFSVCVLVFTLCVTVVVAFIQSFTDSTFGGYVGFILPIVCVLNTFWAGVTFGEEE